ncbi:MAG: cbb3-type cytochrome oxidase assembly protein CcoS [Chlorobi bacterium]|nr:cbb3-type cytochrome oxidase assembly protein CcoS [Chlorobiota bacterium]
MIVIFILIGFSLIVALIFLFLYIWSVKDGQFDDDYTPSVRILFDDNNPNIENEEKEPEKSDNTNQKNTETNKIKDV